jgi:hypothetical protein
LLSPAKPFVGSVIGEDLQLRNEAPVYESWYKASPHFSLYEIPISIFMKVFKAKERQGRYLREMPP